VSNLLNKLYKNSSCATRGPLFSTFNPSFPPVRLRPSVTKGLRHLSRWCHARFRRVRQDWEPKKVFASPPTTVVVSICVQHPVIHPKITHLQVRYLCNKKCVWFGKYIHTYHSHFIPEGVAEASQIFLRDAHVLPKLLSYDEYCRRDRW
jgi:hypothetical protein